MTVEIEEERTDTLATFAKFVKAGWTDGLPVIAPTARRVAEFVERTGRDAGDVVAAMPPLGGEATIRKLAANAVMAGCEPGAHARADRGTVEAAVDPAMNIGGVQCSTHMASPLLIVHGPIRAEIGINSGANTFGQGVRANATLGRAFKLALGEHRRVASGRGRQGDIGPTREFSSASGRTRKSPLGRGCTLIGGCRPTDSAVTIYGAEGPQNINNQAADNPFDILKTVASMMTNLGSNHMFIQGETFVVLCPEHAQIIASCGWTKADVQHFLLQNATRSQRRDQGRRHIRPQNRELHTVAALGRSRRPGLQVSCRQARRRHHGRRDGRPRSPFRISSRLGYPVGHPQDHALKGRTDVSTAIKSDEIVRAASYLHR